MPLYKEYLRHNQNTNGDAHAAPTDFGLYKPNTFNFAYDIVDRIADETPNKTALVWTNDKGGEKTFTFSDIRSGSNRAANAFTKLGIRKGDKVMLILKRHHEFWTSIIALHKIGAVAVPATHLLTPKDIVYRVENAAIKAIICTSDGIIASSVDDALQGRDGSLTKIITGKPREGWLAYDEIVSESSDAFVKPADFACGQDMLLLYFTSGTTGMPKMVAHNHWYPLGHIVTAVYWQQAEDDGLHLTISETGWAKSVWGKLYGQWLAGCAVFVYDFDKFTPTDILRMISRHKITSFCAPPTMYRFMLQEDFAAYDLSSLKRLSVAGEPLNPDIYDEMLKRTGIEMREAFGQTELVVLLGTFPWVKPVPGSMGKPSPLFDVDLIDDDGKPCGAGIPGEIVVRARRDDAPCGMFMGYAGDDDMTRGVWSDGIYHTGDLAWRDEWGYYWYQSRKDDVIKSSGYRIGPFEVESALACHPAVLESAITAAPDELRGQVVKATIRLKPGFEPSDALIKELQNHVKKVTAPYKYPRIIEFVDELPKTISGKIRRVELRGGDVRRALPS